jgi:hypothetical protein
MPATTIDGRLWAACAASYRVGLSGSEDFKNLEPYNEWVGFVDSPTGIVKDADAYNAILVGTTASEIIVAFRGTIPFDDTEDPLMERISDWVVDFHAELVRAPGMAGRVHEGFYGVVEGLWGPLCDEIARRQAENPRLPVYFTGHSKGGGTAPIAARRWAALSAHEPLVLTFGAARCGDQEFAGEFNSALSMLRYENREDCVPHLPPGLEFMSHIVELAERILRVPDYCSIGHMRYIAPDGSLSPIDSTGAYEASIAAARHARIEALVMRGDFDQLRCDHTIWRTGGYQKAVCPGAV